MSTKTTPAKPEDKDKDEGSLASQAAAAVVEQAAAAQKASEDAAKIYEENKLAQGGVASAGNTDVHLAAKVGDYVRSQIGDVFDPLTNLKYTSAVTEVLKRSDWLDKQLSVGKFVIEKR